MKQQLKNKAELFDYLMYAYSYELEDVETKKGIQKRLKDNELEEELKKVVKQNIKAENLLVELKLGPPYNRTSSAWVQLYSQGNKSGAKGRYVGISFSKDDNEVLLWLGFGKTSKKKDEIFQLAKEYKVKYSLIESELKRGFEYKEDCYEAKFIEKKINMKEFQEEEFETDLKYITDLYKAYETRFENATIIPAESKQVEEPFKNAVSYDALNEKMLTLIEEIGNLAREIKKMRKN